MIIPTDGMTLHYQRQNAQQATLSLALDTTENGYLFTVSGLDIAANQQATAQIDTDDGAVVISGAQSGAGSYALALDRFSDGSQG